MRERFHQSRLALRDVDDPLPFAVERLLVNHADRRCADDYAYADHDENEQSQAPVFAHAIPQRGRTAPLVFLASRASGGFSRSQDVSQPADFDRFVQRRHRPESLEFGENLGVRRIVGLYPVMMITRAVHFRFASQSTSSLPSIPGMIMSRTIVAGWKASYASMNPSLSVVTRAT